MVWIPPGKTRLGSDRHYPEERPAHEAELEGFWMDVHPVTNAQFAQFIAETGYVTGAEKPPATQDYPEVPKENLVAGSAVFVQPPNPVDLSQPAWWQYMPGANWRHPIGPQSSLAELDSLPVVHIDYQDALAYANWSGRQLPTEAQWEYAARGGLDGAVYAWGDELTPDGRRMANYWAGDFPWRNTKPHAPAPTPPGTYPPNGYGLFDMCGSVWEWTSDIYQPFRNPEASREGNTAAVSSSQTEQSPCCPPENIAPPSQQPTQFAVRVIKGGSFLCSQDYCSRYRPAARFPQSQDTSTSHLGFRCVLALE